MSIFICSFFYTIRRPPTPTLFPYTTLFRSYPNITQNNLTIDGYSQPGSSPNSNSMLASNNAAIKIVLDSRAGGCTTNFIDGEFGLDESGTLFIVGATNVHIRGLGFLGPGTG